MREGKRMKKSAGAGYSTKVQGKNERNSHFFYPAPPKAKTLPYSAPNEAPLRAFSMFVDRTMKE